MIRTWRRWAVLVAFLVAGCDAYPPSSSGAPPRHSAVPASGVLQSGHDTVRVYHGGAETFVEIVSLIDHAASSVDVEMYEFSRADVSAALRRAHTRGVPVAVIVDPSVDTSAAMAVSLRQAGVDALEYPVKSGMIDHVKLLIVDNSVAIVGGINWGDHSDANHDFDGEVRGPAVTNMAHIFATDLVKCGRHVTVPDVVPDATIIVAATLPGAAIKPLALAVIRGAVHTLDLQLYVLTESSVVDAIIAAHQRGVVVRVLLDPDQAPSDPSAARLRAAGVDVRLYNSSGEKLHAKLVVADSSTVLFGSANWSRGGFSRNHEVDIEIPNAPAIAAEFMKAVEADWASSA